MSAASSNARYNDWFSQSAAQYAGRYQGSAHNPFYPTRQAPYAPNYGYGHHQNVWEHGLAECSCHACSGPLKQAPYFASHGYGQPVMG
jgi:hypothetical protein